MPFFLISRSSRTRSKTCYKHQSPTAIVLFAAAALIALSIGLITPGKVAAQSIGNNPVPDLLAEYGQVIYRVNEDSPKQLYIIGISHRNPASGRNNSDTVRTQAEIFRIGEWLNRYKDLELLLPEGYFIKNSRLFNKASDPNNNLSDNVQLHERLADESHFVNAEMLLMESFDMRASQVEDRNIYKAVRSSLNNLKTGDLDKLSPRQKLAELKFLQELRTAKLLQNIPDVIESELRNGTIRNSFAMFTIGLNHVTHIIRYLDENPFSIDAPKDHANLNDFNAELDLLKKGYGITIILPRTLANNAELLETMNLTRIQLASKEAETISQ
ncbi:MAG: hypothetical protein R6W72_14795 [Desulfurivibrionaceae bacterium]